MMVTDTVARVNLENLARVVQGLIGAINDMQKSHEMPQSLRI